MDDQSLETEAKLKAENVDSLTSSELAGQSVGQTDTVVQSTSFFEEKTEVDSQSKSLSKDEPINPAAPLPHKKMDGDEQSKSLSKEESVGQSSEAQAKDVDDSKSSPKKECENDEDGSDRDEDRITPLQTSDENINLDEDDLEIQDLEIQNLEEQIRDDEISILNNAIFDINASLQVKKKRLDGLKCEINDLLSVVSKMKDPFNELYFVLDSCDKKAFVRAVRP